MTDLSTLELPPQPKFSATPDQQAALDAMLSWLSSTNFKTEKLSDSWAFLLKGYAGTGKTFSITELAKTGGFKPSELCFTAPTNKAVKVLRNYLDGEGLESAPSRTIYSLLGLSLQANGEVKEIARPEEPVDLSHLKVIIVDEASMVNRFLMSAMEDAFQHWKVPFIFMGDPAQLPPVGEITSPVWKIPNSVELTKVLRYGNSMLDLATSIRLVVDHPFPSVSIVSNAPTYKVSKAEWMESILQNLELFRAGEAKVIAWRNVTVGKYNQFIRQHLFGKSEARESFWLPGDKIASSRMLKDLSDETIMRTDEEAEVLQVAVGRHPMYQEFEIFNLLVLDEQGKKITLRTPTEQGAFALQNHLNELSMEAKNGKKYKWREFWKLKEAFHEIRHSYAITSHRSQGSSYRKTFIDLEDIMLNRNRAEAFRSLYVACTRQREEIWIA